MYNKTIGKKKQKTNRFLHVMKTKTRMLYIQRGLIQ